MTPINTATGKPGKAIKVGGGRHAIAITPDGKTAYVANSGSGTVTPIRTATNTARQGHHGRDLPRCLSRSPRTGRPPTSSTAARAR